MCESTAMSSPSSPSAVTALAVKFTFVNTGFAETLIRIGVDEQLLMARFVSAGFDTPNNASPCAASLSVLFDTGIERFAISIMPCAAEFVPNRIRQREID